MARVAVLGLVIVAVAACSGSPAGSTPAPSTAVNPSPVATATLAGSPSLAAPTIRTVDVSGTACAGIKVVGGTIQGDALDPRVAWLDHGAYGTKGLVFPQGFTARFTPRLEILDASGQVKFRAGDSITGGCVWGQDLLIGWP